MNKTLTKKFLYVIAALAMLAMLIPSMGVPVSAAGTGTLTMVLVDPTNTSTNTSEGPIGYNVTGSTVQVNYTAGTSGYAPYAWTLSPNITEPTANSPAVWVGGQPAGTATSVQVSGTWGDTVITVSLNGGASGNTTMSVEKKWGQIDHTTITNTPAYSPVTWSEATKAWSGNVTISDNVTGIFYDKDVVANGSHYFYHAAQGAVLKWYLIPGNVIVDMTPGMAAALETRMAAYQANGPIHVSFAPWPLPPAAQGNPLKQITNVTPTSGTQSVSLYANGEEAVQVVIIPEYPVNPINIDLTPEITSYDFFTTEMEVVPQVRWAGEKIVLEKNFGTTYFGQWVQFKMQAPGLGSLEVIAPNAVVNDSSVWTKIDSLGFASVILVSSDPGVSHVNASLYSGGTGTTPPTVESKLINQHFFTVYFLKMESLTLGDVQGKRVNLQTGAHDSGVWQLPSTVQPTNPWDPTGSYNATGNTTLLGDQTTQTLNVSQDALVRARVRGWFTDTDPSARPARYIDPTNDPTFTDATPTNGLYPLNTLVLPAGRHILPDDWQYLAGLASIRLHWDIMCNPDASVGVIATATGIALSPDYYKMPPLTGIRVSGSNVIGPFSPGLELMTPTGWTIPNLNYDPVFRPNMNTVVPDGKINMWDAPMPPAKIIFQIQKVGTLLGADAKPMDQAGYFKAVDKEDVYYWMVPNNTTNPVTFTKIYTNPFYMEMIPAHEAIPAFINNGGYDWNSFDASYGPYNFWNFINQHLYLPLVSTSDPSGHPTVAEVYSDNHGEAMVWLNGNWNLDLSNWSNKGYADIPASPLTTVGTTTIQATADYPYSRLHQAVQSNKDMKTWTWGGQVLGTDGPSSGVFGDHVTTSIPADTRMVLSAGSYAGGTVTGTFPNQAAKSNDKVVWVWVTDRDTSRAGIDGAMVTWTINDPTMAKINTSATGDLSNYNQVTQHTWLDHGFLDNSPGWNNNNTPSANTGGSLNNSSGYTTSATVGHSMLRVPTATEVQLFNKFWGTPPAPNPANLQNPTSAGGTSNIRANAANYEVAAIDIVSLVNLTGRANVTIEITGHDFDSVMGQTNAATSSYMTNVDFTQIDALDDGIRTGDANCDGVVNIGDVTAVERMILGYSGITSNAVLNPDGTVDMGTVVKIERIILGLN